jgi:hypothetical protein
MIFIQDLFDVGQVDDDDAHQKVHPHLLLSSIIHIDPSFLLSRVFLVS